MEINKEEKFKQKKEVIEMTQKELKALYKEELRKVWDSESMVEYCSKSTAYVVEHNGELYGLKKPKIKTDFCFGAGMYASATDEEWEEAEGMVDYAKKSEEYFIRENLESINEEIEQMKEILYKMGLNWAKGSYPIRMVATEINYSGQSEDCKLRYYNIIYTSRATDTMKICTDKELVEKLIAGLENVKKDFTKRLNTYLKRYGLSKVHSWSYVRD